MTIYKLTKSTANAINAQAVLLFSYEAYTTSMSVSEGVR